MTSSRADAIARDGGALAGFLAGRLESCKQPDRLAKECAAAPAAALPPRFLRHGTRDTAAKSTGSLVMASHIQRDPESHLWRLVTGNSAIDHDQSHSHDSYQIGTEAAASKALTMCPTTRRLHP